jgi:hypothetical protein
VLSLLLRKLLEPIYRDGVVLDGFPRTPVQVECLKLLVEKISALHDHFADTPLAIHFRPPDDSRHGAVRQREHEHRRQLGRGREIAEHNKKVAETGIGTQIDLRVRPIFRGARAAALPGLQGADLERADVPAAALSLPLHQRRGPVAEVQANILNELKYQSSLELDPRTFERLRALPLAEELVIHGGRSWSSGSTATSSDIRAAQPDRRSRHHEVHADHHAARALGTRARELGGSDLQRAARHPDADRHLLRARLSRGRRQAHSGSARARRPAPRRDHVPQQVVYRIEINFEASKIRRG